MATEIWVNIGSGNGLLPDGTKPLPEPMLTDHQLSPVTFILGQFHNRCCGAGSADEIGVTGCAGGDWSWRPIASDLQLLNFI